MELTAYITTDDARDIAQSLSLVPGMGALHAASDADLGSLLLAATLDIDSAMPYQGRRYELDQPLQFPRYVGAAPAADPDVIPNLVWDWDDSADGAVVPQNVKLACVIQAASLLADPAARARLEAIRSGLASQSVGSLSESYLKPGDLPGGMTGLCDRAQRLMDRYRLRSGQLL